MRQGRGKASHSVTPPRGGEWAWGGAGLSVAGGAACFAAYMLVVGPGDNGFRSAGDFGLFARMRPSTQLAGASFLAPRSASAAPASPAAVDLSPTGSVAVAGPDAQSKAATGQAQRTSDRTLASFILRDVFDGRALVESPTTLTLVSKGSELAGAGTVLAIERQGTGWQVVTSRGIIGGAR